MATAQRPAGNQNHQDAQKKNNSLRDFQGINTQAYRTSIGDGQFSWMENVMPVGYGNMIVPPGPSGALASWSGTAYHMRFVVIGSTEYMLEFTTDGACYAVNLSSHAVSTVCAPGVLSGDDSEAAQWEDSIAVIVDANGYFTWNGTTLTSLNETLQSLTITTIGSSYTSAPTIGGFSSGGGSGATATADIQVGLATLVGAGTTYIVGDVLTASGGTHTTAAQVTVSTVNPATGAITGFNLTEPGAYTVAPANPVSVTGGYGTGATFTLNFGLGDVTLTAPGSGYTSNPTITVTGGGASFTGTIATSTLTIASISGTVVLGQLVVGAGVPANTTITAFGSGTGGNGTYTVSTSSTVGPEAMTSGGVNGVITAQVSVVPPAGTSDETYAGRVWVSNNRTILFSAPDSYTDFTEANGGGSFVVTDSALVGPIQTLKAANNFLYVVGASSVHVIADVSVDANGITVFSFTNISSGIGTEFESSVVPYYRALWFANPYGMYAMYGSTAQKASDDLDGLFPNLLLSEAVQSQEISAGTAIVHQILCLCFLVQYNDPTQGLTPVQRSLLMVFFNKKWWPASPRNDLVAIETAIIEGAPVLYATNGSSLYRMFSDNAAVLPQSMSTKLWDMGDPLRDKQTLKFGLELVNPIAPQTITGTIDTENASNAFAFSLTGGNVVDWINNQSQIVQWTNNSSQIVEWIGSGYTFQAIDVETTGKYIGVTLHGATAGTVYSALHLQYELRATW